MNPTIDQEYECLRSLVGNSVDAPGKGGNISIKPNPYTIYIKSSGSDLKVRDHDRSLCNMENGENYSSKKPSMEIGFHKSIPSKYVVHYHPFYVLPFISSHAWSFDKMKELIPGQYVNYTEPGIELTKKFLQMKFEEKGIVYLENHGVIIHADSVYDIADLYTKIKKHFTELLFSHTREWVSFTPDEVVDPYNIEQLMVKLGMIGLMDSMMISPLSIEHEKSLLNSEDEKYRQGKM